MNVIVAVILVRVVVVSYVLACLMVAAAICLLCGDGGCRMERLLFIGPARKDISM
jgi:hypothetical protein